LDRDVQDVALGTSLALKPGNEGSHLVEAVTNRLSAFLFCCLILASSHREGWIPWLQLITHTYIPEEMWFCRFCSSVNRGLSSWGLSLFEAPCGGEACSGEDIIDAVVG
jgi:hypothetical protein